MRFRWLIGTFLVVVVSSCNKYFHHERWVSNETADTLFVLNPDFPDTLYTVFPSNKVMIYGYTVNDHDQAQEECRWLGDTLFIFNTKDSVCHKPVSIESNWFSDISGSEDRKQVCTFTVYSENF